MRRSTLLAVALIALVPADAGVPAAHVSRCGGMDGYAWPVKPFRAPHPVRSNVGDPRISSSGSVSFHNGVDIAAEEGTPVYAVLSGVVVRAKGAGVVVKAEDGRRFQYWHVVPLTTVGARVRAGVTVLGRVHGLDHVHLSELNLKVRGVVRNPLVPGHLAPYRDTRPPKVRSITISGRNVVVRADDATSLPVPAPWDGLPVAPARLTYTVRNSRGARAARGIVFDFRSTLPARRAFWTVYAKGTRQSKAGKPGRYLYSFTLPKLAGGRYVLSVTAEDACGSRGELSRKLTIAG